MINIQTGKSVINQRPSSQIVQLRKTLHRYPELSGEEKETSARLIQAFQAVHPSKLYRDIAGHGLIVQIDNPEHGPTIIFRAELDALPIREKNTFGHRSQTDGVAHKCGHDGHIAILLGLGFWLQYNPLQNGRIIFLFQPAEETGQGAKRVLSDEHFKSLNPDYIFALHNWPGYKMGEIVLKEGPMFCASRGLNISLRGKTAHAAQPETGINPAGAVSRIIERLQQVPSDNAFINQFVSITIVKIHMGDDAFGTSPGSAEIGITIRSDDDDTMERLVRYVKHIIQQISRKEMISFDLQWRDEFPVTANHSHAVQQIRQAANRLAMPVQIIKDPFKPSEDFGWFTQQYKGAIFAMGAGEDWPDLHSDDYDFPDLLIEPAIQILFQIAKQLCAGA
ncbi:MAG: amidohydrolase [Caldithrix sp.]|nr:amidohydrolase [Caldithrix sp.]